MIHLGIFLYFNGGVSSFATTSFNLFVNGSSEFYSYHINDRVII